MRRRVAFCGIVLVIASLAWLFRPYVWAAMSPVTQRLKGTRTVAQRLEEFGDTARSRWRGFFQAAGVEYPPERVTFVGLKQERKVQVYAHRKDGVAVWIRSYPILAASGVLGPKLREGDRQVPEGIYAIESLNPNSRFHVSLRINYPNAFDRGQAEKEGRAQLGGDIMIHGSSVSIGCLAMGDEAAEDLFTLAADSGTKNITVILAPADFREVKGVAKTERMPEWTPALYGAIKARLVGLPPEKP